MGPAQPRDLGIDIRVDAPGEQGIVAEVDARDDVGRAECNLLRLREEIVRIAVQHHLPDRPQRHELFRDDLGRVEDVEAEALGVLLAEYLHAQLPFRIGARLYGFPQVPAVKIRVGAGDLDRLVPRERVRSGHRIPVKFNEARLARRVHEAERVHAESLHHAQAPGYRAVRHHPHQHVGRLRHERHEIPERVVRRCRLRHAVMRLGLDGVNQVRKLHRILDEEHRDVVADEIPVALVGVELHGESADIARGVRRATLPRHGREAHENRGALARLGEDRRAGEIRKGLIALEIAVRGRSARVHDALGNALVVEVGDFFPEDEILQQRRSPQTGLEGVLIVGDRHALVRREYPPARINAHAVERGIARVESHLWIAAANLFRRVRLAERAAASPSGREARRLVPRPVERKLSRTRSVLRH